MKRMGEASYQVMDGNGGEWLVCVTGDEEPEGIALIDALLAESQIVRAVKALRDKWRYEAVGGVPFTQKFLVQLEEALGAAEVAQPEVRHQYVVTSERHPDLPATEYCGYPTAHGPCGKDVRNQVHQ